MQLARSRILEPHMAEFLPTTSFDAPPPEAEPARVVARPLVKDSQPGARFDCSKCPAFCCAVYERVQTNRRDVARLARHFGLTYEQAERRYTRLYDGERVLK